MKTRMILFTTWLNSNPSHIRTIGLGALMALALAASVAPQQIAIAGSATGGSH
jgi:hypothetical protein